MGKSKITKKYSVKRMMSKSDPRLKANMEANKKKSLESQSKSENPNKSEIKTIAKEPTSMFLSFNKALEPPYRILIDTNFVNFSIKNKLDIFKNSMDCLLGKCIPYITDCVEAEMEKFGTKCRLALRLIHDPRFQRLTCNHKGTYADDCIVNNVTQSRCFIVATCDKDLKKRIRKIPGVPIMFIASRKYVIERLPTTLS